jgi:beta-lactamase class A
MQGEIKTITLEKDSLSQAYSAYKEKVGNLRKLSVVSASIESNNNQIAEIINKASEKVTGNISIYYKNLGTNETVIVDGEREYYMASLYKVIVTLYILESEKAGKLSFTDTIGSPPITIEQALNKIITESNNEYAIALAEKYKWKRIEEFINNHYSMNMRFEKDLRATVEDMGLIFNSIAESIKLSDTESTYILDLLNRQTRLSKLPKYLPKHIYSHNKTGELDDYSHDAGIFYTPKANYILVFMSKTPSPGVTNEQMAVMSKEIYEELNPEL